MLLTVVLLSVAALLCPLHMSVVTDSNVQLYSESSPTEALPCVVGGTLLLDATASCRCGLAQVMHHMYASCIIFTGRLSSDVCGK